MQSGGVLSFGHVEGMENKKIAKRAYVLECAGSCGRGGLIP